MTRTITITVTNRPHYLREMLESLIANDLTGYAIHAFCEPGCQESIILLNE